MKSLKIHPRLRLLFSRLSSLLLLFQRSPIIQLIFPEAKILGGSAIADTATIAITTVIGLGAYDSVAGVTIVQTAPSYGSATVPAVKGVNLNGAFNDLDGNNPSGWRIASTSPGPLPTGLTLASPASRNTTLTGKPTQTGSFLVTIEVYDSSHSAKQDFTIVVADANVTVSPASPTRLAGATVTLTATSNGTPPFTYQWYQGSFPSTTTLVGSAAAFTTPTLSTNTNYWVQCTDSGSPALVMSASVPITILTGVTKAGTGTDLAQSGSWAGGAPSGTTGGIWNSTSLGAGLTLNSAATWGGILVSGTLSSADIGVTGTGLLTLGAGGFDLTASSVNMAWGTPVAMGANQTWIVNAGKTLTLSGAVSATSGYSLPKDGAGTLTLSGVNTYTGSSIIKAGTFQIGGAGSLGSGTYANLIINSGTFKYSSSAAQTLSGVISGTGDLVKDTSTTSTLSLTGLNTYSGATTVNAGTLDIASAGTLTSGSTSGTYASAISIGSGATLSFSSTAAQILSGALSGAGNLTKSNNTADLTLTGSNSSFTGNLSVLAGRVLVNQDVNLGGATAMLTLNGGSLRHDNSGTTGNLSRQITIGASGGTLDIASGFTDSVTSLSGSGALTKGGTSSSTGTVNISGASSYSGNITLSRGTLAITSTGNLGFGSYAGNLTNNATFKYSSSATQTFSGTISGSGTFTKDTSSSALTLSGNNSYSGATTISAGTIKLGATGGATNTPLGTNAAGTTVSATGAALDLNGFTLGTAEALSITGTGVSSTGALTNSGAAASYSGTVTLTGAASIGGTGDIALSAGLATNANALTKVGADTLTLNAASSRTGAMTISAGTLKIGADGAMGTNAAGVTVSATGAALDLNGVNYATTSALALTGTGTSATAGALTNSSGTAATYAGSVTLAGAANIGGTGDITLSGGISGTASLTKVGGGTLTLTGSHSYSGATTVTAGSLVVNGTLTTAAGLVTINAGATLTGTSIIQRPVTINGTLAPGNSAGTLSVTGTTNLNGTYAVEVNDATADKLVVTGNLTLGASAAITVNLLAGGFTQPTYIIAECTGTLSGTFASVPAGYKVTYTTTQAILAIDTYVSVTVSPASVAEDGLTNLVYAFARTGATTNTFTANFSVTGTATPDDYVQTGSATFAVGAATAIVTIDPTADTTVEPNETVILTVTSGAGYTVGSPASATGTITNDDGSSPFASWAGVLPQGQNGALDMPQGDGVPNLVKFAFNLDPLNPDVSKLHQVSQSPEVWAGLPVYTMTGQVLHIEFLRRKASSNPGITYTPECGSTLTGWVAFPTAETVTPIGTSDWERVVVDGPVGEPVCFGHLKVTQP